MYMNSPEYQNRMTNDEEACPMKRVKLSKTHSIDKSKLTGNYSLEDTQFGTLVHVGTYTECIQIAKGLKIKPIRPKKRRDTK